MRMLKTAILMMFTLVLFSVSCQARISEENIWIQGIHLGMSVETVENSIGKADKKQVRGHSVVADYNYGRTTIVYTDGVVTKVETIDRAWQNRQGIHCGSEERMIEKTYGIADISGEIEGEISYTYISPNGHSIGFIVVDGYIQEIVLS